MRSWLECDWRTLLMSLSTRTSKIRFQIVTEIDPGMNEMVVGVTIHGDRPAGFTRYRGVSSAGL